MSRPVEGRRYDRIASFYDICEAVVEASCLRRWRRELWGRVPAGAVLELGVGTGKDGASRPVLP